MRKIDEATRTDSTWNKIDDDEPVFILRAQDRSAVSTIRAWLRINEDFMPLEKYQAAQQCIKDMQDWVASHESKIPD